MTDGITVTGPEPASIKECEQVLRNLPEYFGIEEALVQYLDDIKDLLTFHARANGQTIGFLSISRHALESAEVHVMGIIPQEHRKGIGRALVQSAEAYLRQERVVLFQVKTLGETHPNENYKKTRHFYRAMGFLPLEEIPDFWGQGLPTLFMVKPLMEH